MGAERPPANVYVFGPGQVIVQMPRDEAKTLVEKDQVVLEGAIRTNEHALKRALKDLNDKGGVPDSVGPGLLNAFINLEDTKRRDVDSDDDD